MKRDLDLMRRVLQEIERDDSGKRALFVAVEGKTPVEVSYAIQLLHEAGLLHGVDWTPPRSPDEPPLLDPALSGTIEWRAGPITHRGHELLEMSRDDIMWEAAKRRVERRTSGQSLDLIIALLETSHREEREA